MPFSHSRLRRYVKRPGTALAALSGLLEAADVSPNSLKSTAEPSLSSNRNDFDAQIQSHHLQSTDTRTSPPTLQTLPTTLLLQILRSLPRDHLTSLFHGPSLALKRAANLVLTERLALGIAMYLGVEPFDGEQVRGKIMLCGSIKGVQMGVNLGKELREGMDCGRGEGGEVVLGLVGEMGRWNGDVRDVSMGIGRNAIKNKVIDGTIDLAEYAKVGKGRVEDAKEKEDTYQTMNALRPTTRPRIISTNILPNEILLQILKSQPYRILRSLLSLGPCQLHRVAETILFEKQREKLRSPVRRKGSHDRRGECGLWPAVNEKGEEYLGRKFVMVNIWGRGGCEGGIGSGRIERVGQLSLGSYWKVVCEDVEVNTGRVATCS